MGASYFFYKVSQYSVVDAVIERRQVKAGRPNVSVRKCGGRRRVKRAISICPPSIEPCTSGASVLMAENLLVVAFRHLRVQALRHNIRQRLIDDLIFY